MTVNEKTDDEKWDKWFIWHKDWVARYRNEIKEAKGGNKSYVRVGVKKFIKEKYMSEFWEARKRILGH